MRFSIISHVVVVPDGNEEFLEVVVDIRNPSLVIELHF
jgi:hypothetical protein